MPKSRHDEDVWMKPYLAKILSEAGAVTEVEELFRQADLSLPEFYKQLSWEVANGYIHDDEKVLEATKCD